MPKQENSHYKGITRITLYLKRPVPHTARPFPDTSSITNIHSLKTEIFL
jgi:hypothetical protein